MAKTAGWVANSVDPDQMPSFVVSDQGILINLELNIANLQSEIVLKFEQDYFATS